MDGLITLIYIFFILITLIGIGAIFLVNFITDDNPELEKYFYYEDLDRDGNPIEEDF